MPPFDHSLVQQVWLFLDDPVPQGLVVEPARDRRAVHGPGQSRLDGIDQQRLANGFDEKLSLAAALHRDEPPHRRFYRTADREQPVVSQDSGFMRSETVSDPGALIGLCNHDLGVVEKHMILIECTCLQRDRIKRPSDCRPSPPVHRVRMGGGNDVRPRLVNLRVDGESRDVDRSIAFDDVAFGVDADQVRHLDLAEVHAEWIDPERIRKLGVTCGHVAGRALIEAEHGEQPEACRKALLAVPAFLLDCRECGQRQVPEERIISVVTDLTRFISPSDYLFQGRRRDRHLTTRQYARLLAEWLSLIGLDPSLFGTHSLRRTKATLIYRKTGNLRAVQLLLGHTKIESTVRYLGIEVDDALAISEQVEL
jgi:Phage integrase family